MERGRKGYYSMVKMDVGGGRRETLNSKDTGETKFKCVFEREREK